MGGEAVSDDSARPRSWDALLLVAVAMVLLGGAVYYGVGVFRDTRSSAGEQLRPTSSDSDPTPVPTQATEPTEPTAPTESSRPGTCWDGQATASLATCPLPSGDAGLAWVFPSFDPASPQCRPAPLEDRAYAVTRSYTCTERVDGRRVTVAYDEVVDPAQLASWMVTKAGADRVTAVDGARGGRLVMDDTAGRPARITSVYARLPWAVSVFAPDAATARDAYDRIVRQRAPQAIRGQVSG
jgi:hypothetical protein